MRIFAKAQLIQRQVQDDMQRVDDLDLDYLKPEWGDRDSALLLHQWSVH
jgi:hypothetical protein